MDNKELIKRLLFEEISKSDNFIYFIQIGAFNLRINANKYYQSLIKYSSCFNGKNVGIKNVEFIKVDRYASFYLKNDIWLKFQNETELNYVDIYIIIKSIIKDCLIVNEVVTINNIKMLEVFTL